MKRRKSRPIPITVGDPSRFRQMEATLVRCQCEEISPRQNYLRLFPLISNAISSFWHFGCLTNADFAPDSEGPPPSEEIFMSQTRSAQKSKIPGSGSKTAQGSSKLSVPVTSVHKVEADGVRVFYRVAGDQGSPVLLLLHGFPTSSFM